VAIIEMIDQALLVWATPTAITMTTITKVAGGNTKIVKRCANRPPTAKFIASQIIVRCFFRELVCHSRQQVPTWPVNNSLRASPGRTAAF